MLDKLPVLELDNWLCALGYLSMMHLMQSGCMSLDMFNLMLFIRYVPTLKYQYKAKTINFCVFFTSACS